MTNERDSNCIAVEAILLLIYAWSSCPVSGLDILRSMVALEHKLLFLIDFSTGKQAELYSAPGTVESYSKQLATCLSCCWAIAKLLVKEQRCWHCKLINSCQRDPHIYSIRDIFFPHWATRSDSKRGHVDKLIHPFTGPWRIVKSLPGASYKLKFASNPSQKDKKRAYNLSPYPPELIPFQPLDGADSCYSQLYKHFGNALYKKAGIDGFKSLQPFAVPTHFAPQGNFKYFFFLPYQNSMTSLTHFRGWTMANVSHS
jgi:hypothetical protein